MPLHEIHSPEDLKSLGPHELEMLCAEIRHEIVSVSLKNGGHVGASLGAVEIAVALHRIFESPIDSIIWDVGHQAYAHKLLTGRLERFSTLRQTGGISGFLSREESPHDVYGAGHSSTSLSAALGFAFRNSNWTIPVIGDGAMTAGVVFEALNQIRQWNMKDLGPLLIVLNDNQMSISENVGAIPQLLAQGEGPAFFRNFGIETIGPVSGHDLPQLLAMLNGIKESKPKGPVLLHVLTLKGKGYAPAEMRPATFHGVGPATRVTPKIEKVPGPAEPKTNTWSDVFGEALGILAGKNEKVLAITAAMSEGTGLSTFSEKYPGRFFDVGIAEPHAVTFAAGLAAKGWRPFVAIYSTFLQRALDPMIHDVALQNLPVVFCVDRAGLVGNDGPTHHGVFDLVYSSMVPGMKVYTPEFDEDLLEIMSEALKSDGPSFIRYPRGKAPHRKEEGVEKYWSYTGSPHAPTWVVAVGTSGARAREARLLSKTPEKIGVLTLKRVKPLPVDALDFIKNSHATRLYSLEDGSIRGGIGEALESALGCPVYKQGYPDRFIPHGALGDLEKELKLDPHSLLEIWEGP